jgi:hypothetical protein
MNLFLKNKFGKTESIETNFTLKQDISAKRLLALYKMGFELVGVEGNKTISDFLSYQDKPPQQIKDLVGILENR